MAQAPDTRVLTFHLGEERLGMAADAVREVLAPPRLSRVPHAPEALLGVAGLRGEVVPVLSLARLLGREDAGIGRIILADVDGPVGLAVSSVSRLLDGAEAGAVTPLDVAALIAAAMPAKPKRRGAALAATQAHAGQESTQTLDLIAFDAAGQAFALPLTSVEDVLKLPGGITAMPLADAATLGSIGWRGVVLPLLSLAGLLGMEVTPATRRSAVVVARVGTHRLGLVVDAMGAVERVPEEAIDPVSPLLQRGAEARIQAICRLEGGQRLLSVLAAEHLVSRDVTTRLLSGETGMSETMDGAAALAEESFLLFRIGSDHFGLPVGAVQEVVTLPPALTRLPRAPAFVKGVMAWRGEVVPVIDQGERFNGQPVSESRPRVIVVHLGELTAGFMVDAVKEVARVPAGALRPAPDLGVAGMHVFDRVASLEGSDALVLIVSPQELLDRAERDMLVKLGRKSAKTPS